VKKENIFSPSRMSTNTYEPIPLLDVGFSEEMPICRICLDDTEQETLFQPCLCSGSSGWVHEQCLTEWRLTAPNPEAFNKCFSCNYTYKLQEERHNGWLRACLQFLADKPIILFVFNALIVMGLAFMIKLADTQRVIVKWLTADTTGEIFYYYIKLSIFVYVIILIILFLITLIRMKHKCQYLRYYIRIPAGQILFVVVLMIISEFFNAVAGIFFLTIAIIIFIDHHYSIMEKMYRVQGHRVLPIQWD